MENSGLIEKNVDEHVYSFSKFGAKQAIKTLVRLSKIVGKPLAVAAGSVDFSKGKKILDQKIDSNVIGDAIEALMGALDADEVINLLDLLCAQSVLCDGKKINFDKHYEDRLDHLTRVLRAALEVQYGNFFGALSALRGTSAGPELRMTQERTA